MYIWKDGSMYSGGFLDNKRHGLGTYTCHNGEVYSGDYIADQKHGVGIYRWAGGGMVDISRYKDGEKVGEGVRWTTGCFGASQYGLKDGQLTGEYLDATGSIKYWRISRDKALEIAGRLGREEEARGIDAELNAQRCCSMM